MANVKKMTKKNREALIGLMPMRLDAEHTFIPKTFADMKDISPKPTITVKQWDNKTINMYRNEGLKEGICIQRVIDGEGVDFPDNSDAKLKMLEGFVVGWTGFIDTTTDDCEIIPYSWEEFILLPMQIINEVINKIAQLSGVEVRS